MSVLTPTLAIDPATWRACGGRTAFTFTHRLAEDPLLDLTCLAELADALPPSRIEVAGASSPLVDGARVATYLDDPGAPEAPASDLVLTAERDGRAVVLHRIESEPAYRRLVDGLVGEFCALTGATGVSRPEGYVFIGAPRGVTPAHVDHEHNLFLQIAGTKRFTTGEFPDDDLRHRAFEGMYDHGNTSTTFPPVRAVAHDLVAGDGLYVPPPALHLVENGTSLAIALSLVFHDPDLDRAARVYAFNGHLRRAGRTPNPPGGSVWRDQAKAAVVGAWRRVRTAGEA